MLCSYGFFVNKNRKKYTTIILSVNLSFSLHQEIKLYMKYYFLMNDVLGNLPTFVTSKDQF